VLVVWPTLPDKPPPRPFFGWAPPALAPAGKAPFVFRLLSRSAEEDQRVAASTKALHKNGFAERNDGSLEARKVDGNALIRDEMA
jgi:hypothetical protein